MSTISPSSVKRPSPVSLVSFLLIAVSVAVLAWQAVSYLPFLADDALISFRYAARLLDGHGLTWTDGQPVEGYSNLSWILMLVAAGACGVDLILASRVFGVACALLTLVVIGWYYLRERRGDLVSGGAGLLGLALAGPMAVWAIGGLEQPLHALLLVLALVLSFRVLEKDTDMRRAATWASLPLGLLAITRSDGFLFTITIALGLGLSLGVRRDTWRTLAQLFLVPTLCLGGQVVFRLSYYGELLPNPAHVKLGPGHLNDGLLYVLDGYLHSWPLALLALGGLGFALARWNELPGATRGRMTVLIVSLAAWCASLACFGGDIFPARRLFLPALLITILVMIESLAVVWTLLGKTNHRILAAVIVVIALGAQWQAQALDPENKRAVKERWEWDGQVVGLMLKDGFGAQQPLLACTAAGCLPYWSELPCIDMLGLNDYHIARTEPVNPGTGRLGHELGDGRYVLNREPDLVSFCGASGSVAPCFRSGKEMFQIPEFRVLYTPVKFEGQRPYRFGSIIWVRRFSPKIGIMLSDDLVRVPAYLINGHSRTVAHLGAEGRFVIGITPNDPGVILQLPVQSGDWSISAPETSDKSAIMRAVVRTSFDGAWITEGELPLTINLASRAALDIVLEANRPVEIHSLELTRVP